MEPRHTEAVVANPKLRLPGQRGRRRRSGDREEGFPRSFDRGRCGDRGRRGLGSDAGALRHRGWRCRAVGGRALALRGWEDWNDRRTSKYDRRRVDGVAKPSPPFLLRPSFPRPSPVALRLAVSLSLCLSRSGTRARTLYLFLNRSSYRASGLWNSPSDIRATLPRKRPRLREKKTLKSPQ